MKRILLTLAAIISISAGALASYNAIEFHTLEGTIRTLGISDLEITFVDGRLVATSTDGSVEVPLSQLQSMNFAVDRTSAIAPAWQENETIDLYTTTGLHIGTFDADNISAANLPAGIYIVKSYSGHSYKFIVGK